MTALQAVVGAAASVILLVVGIAGLVGPWWACIAAAVPIAVVVVLLYDPAPKKDKVRRQ